MTKTPRAPRRVMTVEYDVSRMTPAQIDVLLALALRGPHDVTFKIELKP